MERVIDLALDSSEEEEDEEQQQERLLDCYTDVDTGQSQGLYSSEPQQTASHSAGKENSEKCNSRTSTSAPSVVVDPEVNVVEVEAAFAARLGYDRATNFVHLSDATDAFMSTVLVALQRHYNTHADLCANCCTRFSSSGKSACRTMSQRFNCGPKQGCMP